MFKIKRNLACLLLGLVGLPAFASTQSLICPFTDNFSVEGPFNTHIIGNYIQGSLTFSQPSSTFFSLSCGKDKYKGGDLFITIGQDECNFCNLTIHDGPYAINPSVSFISCKGNLKYLSLDHPIGTYNYKIKFIE